MVMSSQVDGREAPPRVETCVLCGEFFDSVESLDAHLTTASGTYTGLRCRDPWTMRGRDGQYVFRLASPTACDYFASFTAYDYLGPGIWSLNEPKAAS